jgi:protein-disulfide isomerase
MPILRVLNAMATVAVILAAASVVWPRARPSTATPPIFPVPLAPVPLEGAPRFGAPQAAAVLVVFSDFECEACRHFARTTLPQLRQHYVEKGLLQVAFRHAPNAAIHPHAYAAAEVATCAAEQAAFWDVHDAIFAISGTLSDTGLRTAIAATRVDHGRLGECLEERAALSVNADLRIAADLAIRATPIFLLGLKRSDGQLDVRSTIYGSQALSAFRAAIDPLVAPSARAN